MFDDRNPDEEPAAATSIPARPDPAPAAGPGPASWSDAVLKARAVELEQARNRLDAEEAVVLAEIEARGACFGPEGLRTAAWLAREASLPPGVTKKRVKVANKLREHLPSVLDALEAGRIGWEHARVLADAANPRIVHVVADHADDLVDLADRCLFDRWQAEVNGLARMWDQDGAYDPNEDVASNTLSFGTTMDGLTSMSATFTGELGQIVTQGIETKADQLYRRAVADHNTSPDLAIPSRSTLRLLALAELVRLGITVDQSSAKGPKGPKVDVTLVVNAADPTVAYTPDGVRLADATTRVLLCDAAFTPLIVDNLGVPLDLGRSARFAEDGQRRAAKLRDGGCTFPGCTAKVSWCDVHHCVHWVDGGVTDLCALVCLCRTHHGVVHRAGWSVRLSRDGWATFRSPSGDFWGQRHGRTRTGPLHDTT